MAFLKPLEYIKTVAITPDALHLTVAAWDGRTIVPSTEHIIPLADVTTEHLLLALSHTLEEITNLRAAIPLLS